MTKIVIFDTETTGLLPPSAVPLEKTPRIIELGCVVVIDGKLHNEHNWLIYPEQQISPEITKITGITNHDLLGKPLFGQLLGEIEEVFGGAQFGIAHNAPFDVGMMKNELARIGRTGFPWPAEIICTVQEFKPLFGKRPKLTQLYEKVMGVPLAQTHRAIDDAKAVFEVLERYRYFDQLAMA